MADCLKSPQITGLLSRNKLAVQTLICYFFIMNENIITVPFDYEGERNRFELLNRIRSWPYPGSGQESFYLNENGEIYSSFSNDFGDFWPEKLSDGFQKAANQLLSSGTIVPIEPVPETVPPPYPRLARIGLTADQIWCVLEDTKTLAIFNGFSRGSYSKDPQANDFFIPDQNSPAIERKRDSIVGLSDKFAYVNLGESFEYAGIKGRMILSHPRDALVSKLLFKPEA